MKKISLFLIRHGRQESRLCNVDVSLDEVGIEQAELVGERLSLYSIKKIYSSNLKRALETVRIINGYINVKQECMEDLREIDYGELTGLEDSVIRDRFRDFLKERSEFKEDLPFPGGENGGQVYERAMSCLDRIVDDAVENNLDRIAVVTHGGTIRSILAGVLNMRQQDRLLFCRTLENTSITQLDYDLTQCRYYVERINDYAHLKEDERLLRRSIKNH